MITEEEAIAIATESAADALDRITVTGVEGRSAQYVALVQALEGTLDDEGVRVRGIDGRVTAIVEEHDASVFDLACAGRLDGTTASLITDEEIGALRLEAGAYGDEEMVTICGRALLGDDDARDACVDAINEARAGDVS